MNLRFGRDWRLLAYGFLMMFWSSPGQTYLVSLYGGELRATFSLTHGEFGAAYSLATLASAAVMLWSGRLVDRLDLARYSFTLIALLAVACLAISFSGGVVTLTIALFLLRQTGQGLFSHTAMTTMVRFFDGARATASAIAALGFAVAEACLPVITIALIAWVGWRDTWRITAAAMLLIMIPALSVTLKGHRQRHARYLDGLRAAADRGSQTATSVRHWTRAEVLRDRRIYFAMPAFLAPSFFFTGFFFHQVYLVHSKGWDLGWWGGLFPVYAGVSLVATLVAGPLVDRLGAVRQLPLFSLPLAAGLGLLSLSADPLIAPVFLALTGITTGWAATVMSPFWAEMYGLQNLGAIKALGSALTVLSSALSPALLGWLIDRGVDINNLALGSAIFIAAGCALATQAFRRR